MSLATVPADFLKRALRLAETAGADLASTLEASGIDVASLDDPRSRLTPEQVTAFTQAAWQLTDDELFGIGASPVPRGTFRLICLSLIHRPDLGSALERMADVTRALPVPPITLVRSERSTRLEVRVDVRDDAYSPEFVDEAFRMVTDFELILLHRFAAWLWVAVCDCGRCSSPIRSPGPGSPALRRDLRGPGHVRGGRGDARVRQRDPAGTDHPGRGHARRVPARISEPASLRTRLRQHRLRSGAPGTRDGGARTHVHCRR